MTDKNSIQEVWFFTSELEGERASSFRQERWCKVFISAKAYVRTFNLVGALRCSSASFTETETFVKYRKSALAAAKPMASVREGFFVSLLRRIKHMLLVDLFFPNIILLVLRSLWDLGRSRRSIAIMCSSPPFSLALAGAILKLCFPRRVTLLVDMRDAWALHTSLGGIKWLKRAIERTVLRRADYVTTVSYGLKEEFESAYGIDVSVLYNVATHYFDVPAAHPVDWKAHNPEIREHSLKLVYTGSTPEGFYDLLSIVGGVKAFRSAHPGLVDRLQLIFVGACQEVQFELQRQGGAGDSIVFISHVPHETAKAIQQNADGLIFLAYDGEGNKGVVSTKFFEYLALSGAILPFTLHEGSDVDRLLRRYCGVSLNLLSSDTVQQALVDIAEHGVGVLPRLHQPLVLKELFDDYHAFAKKVTS